MQSKNVAIAVPNCIGGVSFISFQEVDPYFPEQNLRISGVARDSAGNALANCIVKLMETATDKMVWQTISDAGGNYVLQLPVGLSQANTKTYYVGGYLAGSPDVFGTTVNNLTGA
jgi:hypothetical protein